MLVDLALHKRISRLLEFSKLTIESRTNFGNYICVSLVFTAVHGCS